MDFKHTVMKKHPLRDCWMVLMPDIPCIPPYFGSKMECEKAREFAEKKAAEYLLTEK